MLIEFHISHVNNTSSDTSNKREKIKSVCRMNKCLLGLGLGLGQRSFGIQRTRIQRWREDLQSANWQTCSVTFAQVWAGLMQLVSVSCVRLLLS